MHLDSLQNAEQVSLEANARIQHLIDQHETKQNKCEELQQSQEIIQNLESELASKSSTIDDRIKQLADELKMAQDKISVMQKDSDIQMQSFCQKWKL